MAIDGMNHFTVLTRDLDATRNFYVAILGLKEGYRPPLGFPGTWLYAGAQPVLHVVAGRPLPEPPAGVLDHIAFSASDLPAIAAKLKSNGIYYDLQKVENVFLNFEVNTNDTKALAAICDEKEELYQRLWQQYFSSVNIAARKNMKLHIQHMPKRYWRYLVEKKGSVNGEY